MAFDIGTIIRVRYERHTREQLIDELIALCYDAVTGLLARNIFFGEANRFMMEHVVPRLEGGVLPLHIESIQDVLICIGFDLWILNYHNAIATAEGDAVLRALACALSAQFPDDPVGRVGGDEDSVFGCNAPIETMIERARSAARAFSESGDLRRVDYGYATYSDLAALTQRYPAGEKPEKFLANALFDIAMNRVAINKIVNGLLYLCTVYNGDCRLYRQIMVFSRKGVGNPSDRYVASLAKSMGDGQNILPALLAYAIQTRWTALERSRVVERDPAYLKATLGVACSQFT